MQEPNTRLIKQPGWFKRIQWSYYMKLIRRKIWLMATGAPFAIQKYFWPYPSRVHLLVGIICESLMFTYIFGLVMYIFDKISLCDVSAYQYYLLEIRCRIIIQAISSWNNNIRNYIAWFIPDMHNHAYRSEYFYHGAINRK